MRLLLVVAIAVALAMSIQFADAYRKGMFSGVHRSSDFPEKYFTQFLDHFDPNNQAATFQQRYYINDQYYRSGGPIILYINGEGPVHGPPADPNSLVVILAQKYSAVIVTLEHRYYGKSVPFSQLTTDNLKYLTSKHALFDLAVFGEAVKTWYGNAPLVTVGGSYSGALSAWFRLKYPHVTRGSVSSSGVVNAILDFTAFDVQVATSAGEDCADALRATTAALETALANDNAGTKALFNCTGMYDGDFWYMMADSGAEGVQYGYQDELCNRVVPAYQSNSSLLHAYADYVLNVWVPLLNSDGTWTYSTQFQADTSVAENKNERQWWYQTCTELAYFQNAPKQGSIRSHFVNMTYHKTHCAALFGDGAFPDVTLTNWYYGATGIAATNVIYTQGSQDPWQQAGVQQSLDPLQPEVTITCHNCGHCVDLRGCPGGCADPAPLDKARAQIVDLVGLWLAA